jgi:hypothetical protein
MRFDSLGTVQLSYSFALKFCKRGCCDVSADFGCIMPRPTKNAAPVIGSTQYPVNEDEIERENAQSDAFGEQTASR